MSPFVARFSFPHTTARFTVIVAEADRGTNVDNPTYYGEILDAPEAGVATEGALVSSKREVILGLQETI
jgi:hypothetical protein